MQAEHGCGCFMELPMLKRQELIDRDGDEAAFHGTLITDGGWLPENKQHEIEGGGGKWSYIKDNMRG